MFWRRLTDRITGRSDHDLEGSLSGAPQTLSDNEGRFGFDSLHPGDYRAVASFDVKKSRPAAAKQHAKASATAALQIPD